MEIIRSLNGTTVVQTLTFPGTATTVEADAVGLGRIHGVSIVYVGATGPQNHIEQFYVAEDVDASGAIPVPASGTVTIARQAEFDGTPTANVTVQVTFISTNA